MSSPKTPALFFAWDAVVSPGDRSHGLNQRTELSPSSLPWPSLQPGVIPALRLLQGLGFRLLPLGQEIPWIRDLLASQGLFWDDCLSQASDQQISQDTGHGLIQKLVQKELHDPSIDFKKSALVGKGFLAQELEKTLGLKTLDLECFERPAPKKLPNGFQQAISQGVNPQSPWMLLAQSLVQGERSAAITRETHETSVAVQVDLDRAFERCSIQTGIGFFDHMLEQIAHHGGFYLSLIARGDLHIDDHHLIEDSALCLGKALNQALGSRKGIERYGFIMPMDEAVAFGALDLSGRPYFSFQGYEAYQSPFEPPAARLAGSFNIEMIPHFFSSLCQSLGATLHLAVKGHNRHHQIEAVFKCFGRLLGQAVRWSSPSQHPFWHQTALPFAGSCEDWRLFLAEMGMAPSSPSSKGALGLELGQQKSTDTVAFDGEKNPKPSPRSPLGSL